MDKIGPKFEVGKIYVSTSGLKARCLYSYETDTYNCMFGEVLETNTNSTLPRSIYRVGEKDKFSGYAWSEYRETVVVKGIRYVMSDDSSVWTQKEFSSCEKSYLAGRIEFTVTDGKLTDVKIL